MTNKKPDLLGVTTLHQYGGRRTSIFSGYKAHCQVDYSEMQYPYRLDLVEINELSPGKSCHARLTFMFGTIKELGLNIDLESELQLNEGGRNIGIFKITKIYQ